ncbi:MAG: isopentenyl-diphosphate Delta-isomerase [Bacteroidetes bacterium]|nr:isopentenyl-diphosphate Delta-isomerase [Bacteroidota bacterium]
MKQKVILVDDFDCAIGSADKMKAHEEGLLHRAFSAFIVNNRDELLLQKRAGSKYHSPGLWTNTCCSHPAPGEALQLAAEKRLVEEMGISCSLTWLFKFMYKASFENKLTEHEIDHVFLGRYEANPIPNPDEVADWRWVNMEALRVDLKKHPHQYTYWLCHIYDSFYDHYMALRK